MTRVEVAEGVTLAAWILGEGAPIVFVHSGAATHAMWDHQVAALCPRARTITYDLRGCGASDVTPSGYSVETFAADLAGLLTALDLERPTIVAHGLGAHIALRLAATEPHAVGRLALAAAAPWFVGDRHGAGGFSAAFWDRLRAGALRDRGQADLDLITNDFFHRPPSAGLRAWLLSMAHQWPLGVFTQLAGTLEDVDHRDALPTVTAPTLLLHGRHDRKTRYEGARYLATHLPNAELVTFEESAHCPHLEEVEAFNSALAAFCDIGSSTTERQMSGTTG